MNARSVGRRAVLAATGSIAVSAGCLNLGSGDDSTDDGNQSNEEASNGTADETEQVSVGPNQELVFDPASLRIPVDTTVRWEWKSDNHNVVPVRVPQIAEWEGYTAIEDEGFSYEHTFGITGRYEYQCDPHAEAGMTGEILVEDENGNVPTRGPIFVGPDGDTRFDPDTLTVEPDETVRWEWRSDNHNVVPTSIPDEATWEGHPEVSDAGTVYEHSFEVAGTYEYECEPHSTAGMTGEIHVEIP